MGINSKAQSWSIDIAIGVVIFIGAFFMFYALINANPNTKVEHLKEEASQVITQIVSSDSLLKVVEKNEINQSRLNQMKNLTYAELKRMLNIESDFCIYIEDDKGNIVLINDSYRGIGSSTINLSNVPCSQP